MRQHRSVPSNPADVLGGLKVLFVDDSREDRELFTVVFESYGAKVATAGSFDEALTAFARLRPELLISDVVLPDRDGFELIRAIRQGPDTTCTQVPAIAVTGWLGDQDRRRALEAGYSKSVSKPVDYDDLLSIIAEHLDQIEALRAARECGAEAVVREPARGQGAAAAAPAPSPQVDHRGNLLLALLPAREREAVLALATRVDLEAEQTLGDVCDAGRFVYLPDRAVVSLLRMVESGKTVEVCSVGRNGMVPNLALGPAAESLFWLRVQMPGEAWRLWAPDYEKLLAECPTLSDATSRLTSALLFEVSQSAVCNRVHTIDRQVAKWLLTLSERAQSSVIRVTHESIAERFGTRRSSISLALEEYGRQGVITASRGRIRIADRERLLASSCECYDAVQSVYRSLFADYGMRLDA